jgi:ferredoxin, 2Fe-2S
MSTLTVTFTGIDGTVRKIENAAPGQSLMQLATAHNVVGIYADCGGGCTCGTCHVYVDPDWQAAVGPPNPLESELLDMAENVRRANSRLSCQIALRPELDGLHVTVAPDTLT